jgi:large subunit ribosomal protein L18
MLSPKELFNKRKKRVRFALKKKNRGLPRLSVHKSNSHIYAQLIDDAKGVTIASASTKDKEVVAQIKSKNSCNIAAAEIVGKVVAERAKKQKVQEIVFDRGGFIYHGKVKAVAEAAREAGLKF